MPPRDTPEQQTDETPAKTPAGAPEPRGVPKSDRARTETAIEATLPPEQRRENAPRT